jgi:ERCC4-type nuclease
MNDDEDDDFNRFLPFEFLKKLPGIDSNNINEITRNTKNMVDLCAMNEDDLKKLIGPRNAKELKNFIEKKVEIIKDNGEEDL